jgi:hypothetical protein
MRNKNMEPDSFIFGSLITFTLLVAFNKKPIYEYLQDLKSYLSSSNNETGTIINYME